MDEQVTTDRAAVKGHRRNTLLACVTDQQFQEIDKAAAEQGLSRSSLVYLLLFRGTEGFANLKVDEMGSERILTGARPPYRNRVRREVGEVADAPAVE